MVHWAIPVLAQGAVTAVAGMAIAAFAFWINRKHRKQILAVAIVDALANFLQGLGVAVEHFMAVAEVEIPDGPVGSDENIEVGKIQLDLFYGWLADYFTLTRLTDAAGTQIGLLGPESTAMLRRVRHFTVEIRHEARFQGIVLDSTDLQIVASREIRRDPRSYEVAFNRIKEAERAVDRVTRAIADDLDISLKDLNRIIGGLW